MSRSSSFHSVILASVAFGALCAGAGTAQAQFKQTNLVSDIAGLAAIEDPNLKNPWGVSNLPGSPFWVSDQVTGTSTLYTITGSTGVAPANLFPPNSVAIPAPGPSGQVANPGKSFLINPTPTAPQGTPALFIFANLNGSIAAWNTGNIDGVTNPTVVAAPSTGGVYTGLAINSTDSMLYAADGSGSGSVQVFNGSFANVTPAGSFVDPKLPAADGLVPFNVEDIGGKIYVSYAPAGRTAQQNATGGMGAIAVFDESGGFLQELISPGGELDSPWGMAIAPTGFGQFGGDLLVGNFAFGESEINAFDATTGAFIGRIGVDSGGNQPGGLWDLTFGNNGTGNPNTLYFTDGLNGETDGLFAAITVPEPSTWAMMLIGFGGLGLWGARRRRASPAIG